MSGTTLQNGYYYGDVSQTDGDPVPNTAPGLFINAGETDVIAGNTSVYLGGVADIAGTLAMGGDGTGPAYLYIEGQAIQGNVTYDTVLTLEGGGTLLLSDTAGGNFIGEPNAFFQAVLINEDTITGAGQFENFISNNGVAVTNRAAGVIDASGVNALLFSQRAILFPLINDGLVEATNTGGLIFSGQQVQQFSGGTILAAGAGDNVVLEDGSDINGGALVGTGGGAFVVALSTAAHDFGDTLDGSTVAVNIATGTNLTLDDNLVLTILGTIDNQGTIALAGTGDATGILASGATVVLQGGGQVTLSDNANNYISGNGALINLDNTITGAGDVNDFVNQDAGIIEANGTLNALVLGGSNSNAGLVEATGSGGLDVFSATLDQSAGGTLAAAGGNVYLEIATIIGGTLASTNGGALHAVEGAHGAGVTLDGTTAAIDISSGSTLQADNGAVLELYGTIDNAGSIVFAGVSLGGSGDPTGIVAESGTVVLQGGGQVGLGDSANDYISGNGALINIDNTITGAGVISSITNAAGGVIDATGTLNALTLNGTIANPGLVEATGSGGLDVFNATLDQSAGGTLAAAGGNVYLEIATVIGGTLAARGGGVLHAVEGAHGAGVTLDGTTAAVNITTGTVLQADDGEVLNLEGTINNAGSILLASTGDATGIVAYGTMVALQGGGQILLSDNANNDISGNGVLLNVDDTISGAGAINGFTNAAAGVIDASGALNALALAGTNSNAGLVEATGAGGLDVFSTTLDQSAGGTLAAAGAGDVVFLQSATVIGGTLATSDGGLIDAIEGAHGAGAGLDGTTEAVHIATGTQLEVDAGEVLGLTGTLENAGTIAVLGDLANNGTIFEAAGNLITGAITGAGEIVVTPGTTTLGGAVGGGQTIAFASTGGTLALGDAPDFQGTISGFALGDIIDFSAVAPAAITGENFNNGVLTLDDPAGNIVVNFTDPSSFADPLTFASDGAVGTEITFEVTCYARGTRIATARGEVEVEALKIGDWVKTLHAGMQKVKWIGTRSYAAPFANHVKVLPVCIQAGALAEHVPSRDLYVSPGHAICIDGVLIHASRLVNGVNITQAKRVDEVTYFHIELETHEAIFAENCPAESFMGEYFRAQFHNAASYGALYPRGSAPEQMCLPRLDSGFQLLAIQRRLAGGKPAAIGALRGYIDQAGPEVCSGWAQDLTEPETPVCLDIFIRGKRVGRVLANLFREDVRAAGYGSGACGFELRLPAGVRGQVEVRRSVDGAELGWALAKAS
jgi:hypothetical protein